MNFESRTTQLINIILCWTNVISRFFEARLKCVLFYAMYRYGKRLISCSYEKNKLNIYRVIHFNHPTRISRKVRYKKGKKKVRIEKIFLRYLPRNCVENLIWPWYDLIGQLKPVTCDAISEWSALFISEVNSRCSHLK